MARWTNGKTGPFGLEYSRNYTIGARTSNALVHMVSSLRGPALTAHRSFSEEECVTVESCMHALDM